MLLLSIILLALVSPGEDILGRAEREYQAVESYQVTLRSQSATASEVIRYYYKRPGYVRMEFVKPHKGAILIYDPHEKKVTLRPFGLLKPLVLRLSPENRLIKSSRGHRVDESDIGFLLGFVKELASDGVVEVMGEDAVNGREAIRLRVKGREGIVVGGEINRYSIWLDKSLLLPIKVISYDSDGEVIEDVLMDDLEVNVGLRDEFFSF
jgi:outer membrane lipoprotein-sorting protein